MERWVAAVESPLRAEDLQDSSTVRVPQLDGLVTQFKDIQENGLQPINEDE